jgi:hypothetical protein
MDKHRILRRFGGLISLIVSCVAVYLIGLAVDKVPEIGVQPAQFNCPSPIGLPEVNLALFSTKLSWLAMVTLEAVTAFFSCLLSAFVFSSVAKNNKAGFDKVLAATLILGLFVVAKDVSLVWSMRAYSEGSGFLSRLLATLPAACQDVRNSIVWARMLGEPPGFFIGIAMSATMIFSEIPTPLELLRRSRQLNYLLYAASLLFVVGLLVTRANISWILAQWDPKMAEKLTEPLAKVVASGVLISGAAYSAILLVFFVPVRCLLGYQIERAMMESELPTLASRDKWLKNHGFSRGWKEDAQQILAIIAPVVSVPIFDALTKI